MISFSEAEQIILQNVVEMLHESLPLEQSNGRILATDVFSDMNMPPFNKSAVDGFACRKQDLGNKLQIIETIAAGTIPTKTIGENQCSRIMTGAMLPSGADYVMMVENTQQICNTVIKCMKTTASDNICFTGEDIKKGSLVLRSGSIINPQHIAVMASVGCHEPVVYKLPRLGIISTGDELVEPDEIPQTGKIRNSNSWQLMAQARSLNVIANYYGIAKDNDNNLTAMISKALAENDILLISGGVSMGDFDLVPGIMKKLGIELIFQSIAIQPGKPTVFGRKQNKYCFGLPGNPVATFLIFELLVKPLLYKTMGHLFKPITMQVHFQGNYQRRVAERISFVPVRLINPNVAAPVEYNGSAHVFALLAAQGFVKMEIGQTQINNGDLVNVRLI